MSSSSPTSPLRPATTPMDLMSSDERGLYLIHLLLSCATHVSAGALDKANACLEHISLICSPSGDAIQRVAAHFSEALAHHMLRSWAPGLYRAVRTAVHLPDAILARYHFFDLCPFLKLSSLISNQSILDALAGERLIHIVDLGGITASPGHPIQWLALLHAFSNCKPPPYIQITAVCEHKDVLDQAAAFLYQEAERLNIRFRFNQIVSRVEDISVDQLKLNANSGEVVAISAVLQLSCLLAEETRLSLWPSKRASFLSELERFSPKVVVVVEQELDCNGYGLGERFAAALNYYAAMFDCLESAAPRGSVERGRVERVMFGEEIKSIIACEGVERKGMHERMEMAGFGRMRVSDGGVEQARRLLQRCEREGYGVREEEGGSAFICWQERALFSVSAWSCRR